MSGTSAIEWTDATWNPVRGCTRVSEGCRHCYAERIAGRFSGPGQPYDGLATMTTAGPRWTGAIRLVEDVLTVPLTWRRPRRVFVNSMSDLFHPGVPDEYIDRVFAVMALSPQHTYQVLTKRPERMRWYLSDAEQVWERMLTNVMQTPAFYDRLSPAGQRDVLDFAERDPGEPWPLPNVWLGVSVENQAAADERIPLLVRTPAAVRWISAEPLLGPLDLARWLSGADRLDWVVAGGESGPSARPMDPDWARSVRDQCTAAGVAFFFKQWGEYRPAANDESEDPTCRLTLIAGTHTAVRKAGKHAAGRVLDGRTWEEYPR